MKKLFATLAVVLAITTAGAATAVALPTDPAATITATGHKVRVEEGYFTSTDALGTKIHYKNNIVEGAKGNVVVVHGVAEHLGRFEYVAQALNNAGYNVFRLDHRGHGKSVKPYVNNVIPRGHIDDFHSIADDIHTLTERAKREHPGKTFLLGHSMGALAAQFTGIKYPGFVDGIVTNGGGIPLSPSGRTDQQAQVITPRDIAEIQQTQAPALTANLPLQQLTTFNGQLLTANFASPLDIRLPSPAATADLQIPNPLLGDVVTDPVVLEDYYNDPLIFRTMSIGLLQQMTIVASLYNALNAKSFTFPTLIMHGEHDEIVPGYFDDNWFNAIGSTDKQYIIWKGQAHEVFNDYGKDEALATVVGWLNAHSR